MSHHPFIKVSQAFGGERPHEKYLSQDVEYKQSINFNKQTRAMSLVPDMLILVLEATYTN